MPAPYRASDQAFGQKKLDDIRALAAGRIAELTSLTMARFDGVERTPADPAAIAESETCLAIVYLCDFVCSDAAVLVRAVRVLGQVSSR